MFVWNKRQNDYTDRANSFCDNSHDPMGKVRQEKERAAVVHLNFRAESTFPVPVLLYLALERTSRGAKRLTRSDVMLHRI